MSETSPANNAHSKETTMQTYQVEFKLVAYKDDNGLWIEPKFPTTMTKILQANNQEEANVLALADIDNPNESWKRV